MKYLDLEFFRTASITIEMEDDRLDRLCQALDLKLRKDVIGLERVEIVVKQWTSDNSMLCELERERDELTKKIERLKAQSTPPPQPL